MVQRANVSHKVRRMSLDPDRVTTFQTDIKKKQQNKNLIMTPWAVMLPWYFYDPEIPKPLLLFTGHTH